MPYVFDQIFAVDEANPQNVARNSSVLLYQIGDVTKTPVTITTPGGDPLPNPVIVNENGFGPIPMHQTLDSLAWEGGGFGGVMRSYDGMKDEAVAARAAAEAAAAEAATAGAAAAAEAASALAGAVSDAEAAQTAAESAAALVGAPADTAMAAAANNAGSQFRGALNATYVSTLIAIGTGIDPTGATDSTPALQALADSAATFGAAVSFPPGVYRINALTLGPLTRLVGLGGNTTRIGAAGVTKPLVIFKHQTSSTQPMVTINGGGVAIENVEMQGNFSTAPLLHVQDGFESKLSNVRLISVGGTALTVRRANNTKWENVYVDNCGSSTAAAVVIKSPTTAEGGETNTFDIYNLTIERSANVALDIAYGGTRTDGFYAEFVRITNLHVEAPNDLAGAYNTDPLLRIGNVRGVTLVNPFIYGGPGYLIEHASDASNTAKLAEGVFLVGGSLLGQEDDSSTSLVHLVTGNDFSMTGVRAGRFTTSVVKVESTYGAKVKIDPSCSLDGATTVWLTDSRTGTGANWDWAGSITAKALTVGSNAAATPISAINGAAGTARRFSLKSGGVDRWFIQAGTAAEGGNNSGSDLEIVARTDGGGSLGNVLTLNRRNRTVEANVGFINARKAGAPTDADFAVAPGDGTTIVDTTNSKLYIRVGGVWKSVTLA